MSKQHCLRCKTVSLVEVEHYKNIRFFECSNCGRGYALKPGKQLTFRWLHPFTLALYDIISNVTPVERAESIAQKFAAQCSREKLVLIVRDIRLELDNPTQRVRDTLDCRASEEELRQYLLAFCECVEEQASAQ